MLQKIALASVFVLLALLGATTCRADTPDRSDTEREEALRVWLVFNLAPVGVDTPLPAVDDLIRRWGAAGIDLRRLREKADDKARSRPEFLRQLLGQEVILEQLAQFRRDRPGFPRIDVEMFGWDEYWDTLRSTPMARQPDLAQIPSSWCSSLAGDLGVLAPLTDAQARQVASDADARFLEPCRVNGDGPPFGVPWLLDVRMLFYWRDDLPHLEDNLETFASAREAFRASLRSSPILESYKPFGLPTGRDWELLHQFSLLVWGERGELVQRRGLFGYHWGEATFREPALRAAEYVEGLVKDGLIDVPRETRQTLEGQFVRHQLGSLISGPWLLGQLPAEAMPHVGMALPPFYDHAPVTFAGGSLLGMTGREPRLRDRAWELAQFLATGKGALPLALAAGLIPASNQTRGSASAAIDRPRALALAQGSPCLTYFECVLARTHVSQYVSELDRALRASRTLPALPNWWQLEVPAHLGSLFYFWQELAVQQPRESLDASLRIMTQEWNDVLKAPLRNAVAGFGAILFIAIVGSIAYVILQRGRVRADEVMAEALRREERTRERLLILEEILARIQKATREPFLVEPKPIEDLTKRLVVSERARLVEAEVPRRFVVSLPTSHSDKLTITHHGQPIKNGGTDAQVITLLDYVMRQSLLQQRPITFSIVTAALCLWTPKTSVGNPSDWLEPIVAKMRKAFGSKVNDVIGKGKGLVYGWMLRESDIRCLIGTADFVVKVRDPYLEAVRRQESDPAAAFSLAIQAFIAEQDLARKDLEIVLLVCELSQRLDLTAMEPDIQTAVGHARQEAERAASTYGWFFGVYSSLDTLLASAHITPADDVVAHWESFTSTWERLQQIVRMTDAKLEPEQGSQPPAEIRAAWATGVRLAATVDSIKTFSIDDREDFADAVKTILDRWSAATIPGIIRSVSQTLASLQVAGKTRERIEHWTESHAREHLGNFVLARLHTGSFPGFRTIVTDLNTALCTAFRQIVEHSDQHPQHPLLALLAFDPASPRSPAEKTQLRTKLLSEPWPTEFDLCLSYAYHAAHPRLRSGIPLS